MSQQTWIDGPVDASPQQAGYNPENLTRLEKHFEDLIEKDQLQCASYLLSRNGRIFAHRFYGPRDQEGRLYGPDSIRMIASVTKMFTAVAVMKLIEDGKLYLYQSLASLIPEFDTPQHRSVNLVHLLTHTSGLVRPDGGSMCEPYPHPYDESIYENGDISRFYKMVLAGPVLRAPGTEWMYSTASINILADVVYRVSGRRYEDYVQREILDPLGMKDSYFQLTPEAVERLCRTADEHVWGLEPSLPDSLSCMLGGGGLYCTAHDLWRFSQMLLNEGELDGARILGPASVRAMRQNQLHGVSSKAWGNDIKDMRYGLGLALYSDGLVTPDSFGHEGAGRCKVMIDPKEQFVGIYFVPTDIEWVPESIQNPLAMIWAGIN